MPNLSRTRRRRRRRRVAVYKMILWRVAPVVGEGLGVVGEKLLHEGRAGGEDIGVRALEIAGVIWVGNVAAGRKKVAQQHYFIAVPARREADDIAEVEAVHKQNVVGILYVGKSYLTGTVGKPYYAVRGERAGSGRIDGVALLIRRGGEGQDIERRGNFRLLGQPFKYGFGHGRAADIAEADKTYGYHFSRRA